MFKGMSEFINSIIQTLNSKSYPENHEMNLWEVTINQIKNKNSIDGRCYSIIQNIVNQSIKNLRDEEVMQFWKETELSINRDFEPEDIPIDSLKFDLEEEIMDEITTIAWTDTENHTLH
jgi:predicted nucleic acid-binding protein